MRVLPLENEEVNEMLARRPRSLQRTKALNSATDRLTSPMIKQNGEWKPRSTGTAALNYVVGRLQAALLGRAWRRKSIGALASPHEHRRRAVPARPSLDARPRQREHRPPHPPRRLRQRGRPKRSRPGRACAGSARADRVAVVARQRVLVVGSFLRKDHPLFAQRIRQAARNGRHRCIRACNALNDDWLMTMGRRASRPRRPTWLRHLGWRGRGHRRQGRSEKAPRRSAGEAPLRRHRPRSCRSPLPNR